MWHWASHPLSKLITSLEDLQHVCCYAKFHHHALFKILITTGMYNCYSQLPSEDTEGNTGFITFPMSHNTLTHQDWLGDGMSRVSGQYQKPGNQPSGEEPGQKSSKDMWCPAHLTPFSSSPASDPQKTWRRIQKTWRRIQKPEGGFRHKSWRWWRRRMRMGIMEKIHDEQYNSDDK